MEHYSVTEENEVLICVTQSMSLGNVMLNERRQPQNVPCYMIAFS